MTGCKLAGYGNDGEIDAFGIAMREAREETHREALVRAKSVIDANVAV